MSIPEVAQEDNINVQLTIIIECLNDMMQKTVSNDATASRPAIVRDADSDLAAGNYTMNPTSCTDRAMNQYTATPVDQRSYDANGNLTSVLG